MAERRKMRRRLSSSSSRHSMSEEQTGSSEEPKRSQMSEAEPMDTDCVPVKSNQSMGEPVSFGVDKFKLKRPQIRETEPMDTDCVPVKSNQSMGEPLSFGVDKLKRRATWEPSSCSVCKEALSDPVQFGCGHQSCRKCVSSVLDQGDSPEDHTCIGCGKKPRGDPQHHGGESPLLKARRNFKEAMKDKFTWTSEGNGDQMSSLNSIYTNLFITTGESAGLHEERTFRHRKPTLERKNSEQTVRLRDIFNPLPGQEKLHRTVLTKGVAGIGKSFAVQKFVLDWAEEEENQDIDFIFILAFREVNLIRGNKSLHELLTICHTALKSLKYSVDFFQARIVVILDGLDESRLQLDFKNKMVTSVSEVTSVGHLLTNLIQGNLLPEAKLWITSRPAAADQIPADLVDMVTEIRGFSDSQKEEYYRKRFSRDLGLPDRIISHICSSQSLNIMCQIPIFCWIAATLFQEVFGGDEEAEVPETLTEMMAYFLFSQTKRRSAKYDMKIKRKKEGLLKSHREFLLRLGKLAFVQLQNNNLIFYDEDLEEYDIDINEASIHSGFFNAVLRKEEVFSQKKVFFFVHLTIQEFFAALFVYDCFTSKKTEELGNFLNLKDKDHTLLDLLKMTVDKVLEKKNGHLDFFLRFLLGLMAEPNRRVLEGLLISPDPSQETDKKILTYLKNIRRKTLSPDSCINLFQAMVEMKDHKVKNEIEEYLTLSDPSKTELTPLHCSALAYMLQVSRNHLDVFNLKSYRTSDEGRRRLIPAVTSSRKAILADCKVTAESVELLAVGLKFPDSALRYLDLSNNDLRDAGVSLLCEGLLSQTCRLRKLSLSGCLVTEKGCDSLASALKSNPSHLTELDLTYNNLGDSGEKQLSELKDNTQYGLSSLRVEHGGIHRMKPGLKKYACELTLNPNTAHKNLLLSEENRKVTWVGEEQRYPHHQERFNLCQQVLCEQGLDGRHYWEVELLEPFNIGATYQTIVRKGDTNDCKLGRNNKSWCLSCSDEGCYVLHNDEKVSVKSSLCSRSSRVGIYLDKPAGTLSFYRVTSDSPIHIYTFKTTFTDPLFPAVQFHSRSFAFFCPVT